MRSNTLLFFGIFVVMALSNAIVPVLPLYATGSALQGAVYSAYFLGAFVITLPAGILSDRYGRIPLLRIGILLTLGSGILLLSSAQPAVVIVSRFVEGIGGGCFVAAAMAYVNTLPGHRKESGIFMAMMNIGLVSGLALSGWLAVIFQNPSSGIMVFTALSIIPVGMLLVENPNGSVISLHSTGVVFPSVRDNFLIWYSSIILIGITGVVASLYPTILRYAAGSYRSLDRRHEHIHRCGCSPCVAGDLAAYRGYPVVCCAHVCWSRYCLLFATRVHRYRYSCGSGHDLPDGNSFRAKGKTRCFDGTLFYLKLSGNGRASFFDRIDCRRVWFFVGFHRNSVSFSYRHINNGPSPGDPWIHIVL